MHRAWACLTPGPSSVVRLRVDRLVHDEPSHPADRDTTLRPPRFSLRTLFLGITAISLVLAVMVSVGVVGTLGLLLFLLLIAAHVAGNSLGTRLRDGGDAPLDTRPSRAIVAQTMRNAPHIPPPQRLCEHKSLPRSLFGLALLGALVTGYLGGRTLSHTYPDAPRSAIIVAHLSSAVLGAFAVFILTSFLAVARQAFCEAHAESENQAPAETHPDAPTSTSPPGSG